MRFEELFENPANVERGEQLISLFTEAHSLKRSHHMMSVVTSGFFKEAVSQAVSAAQSEIDSLVLSEVEHDAVCANLGRLILDAKQQEEKYQDAVKQIEETPGFTAVISGRPPEAAAFLRTHNGCPVAVRSIDGASLIRKKSGGEELATEASGYLSSVLKTVFANTIFIDYVPQGGEPHFVVPVLDYEGNPGFQIAIAESPLE